MAVPQMRSTPAQTKRMQDREARRLVYAGILLQEAGVDLKKIPPDQVELAMASPYERVGVTGNMIEQWIQTCDPVVKPAWDEITCFRQKARAALKPPPSLGKHVAIIGGAAFLAVFVLMRLRR